MQVLKTFFQCSVDSIPRKEKMENNANVTSTKNDIFVYFSISYQTAISDFFFWWILCQFWMKYEAHRMKYDNNIHIEFYKREQFLEKRVNTFMKFFLHYDRKCPFLKLMNCYHCQYYYRCFSFLFTCHICCHTAYNTAISQICFFYSTHDMQHSFEHRTPALRDTKIFLFKM